MLKHYQNQACPELSKLMQAESITYSVLINILQAPCTDIFADGENVVVCYSCAPWPVWVWCRDDSDGNILRQIADCLMEHFSVEQGYDIILSHWLLEKLRETDGYFSNVKEGMGLLSYRLDAVQEIAYPCDGCMGLVCEEEIPGLVEIWQDMHMEMEGRCFSPDRCAQSIRRMVEQQCLFAWRNSDEKIVALTGRGNQPPYSKITSVYTLPQYRRKGYAINLVHGVTKTILEDGLIPILYTDAGYEASNTCYQKIGYHLVGRLTSICK